MHWADVVAEKLLGKGKKHVLATAITPSGPIHIGNMREVLTTEAIYRALIDKGGDAKLIYIGDTFDSLRKVYPFLPASYEKYVGKPLSEIPCPCGSHENYAQHFLSPFLESLKELGIKPKVYLAHELYRNGRYNEGIKVALNNADKIREILTSVAKRDLPEKWMPLNARCEKCSRLTGNVISYEYPFVYYKCLCGNEGKADIRMGGTGKLPWRVDWPARWKIFGVTFEAFGKDHAAAGGSWDTGRVIAEKVYNYPHPMPFVYEFIHLKGKGAMHGSTGTAIAAEKMLKMTPPEVLRFLLMKYEPSRHIEFDSRLGLLDLVDEYDKYERIVFGEEGIKTGIKDVERIYRLSQPYPKAHDKMPQQVPYRHLVTLVQIAKDWKGVHDILKRNGEIGRLDEYEEKRLMDRLEKVRYWLDNFAPEQVKFEVRKELPEIEVTGEKKFFSRLRKKFEGVEWNAEEIHKAIYEAAEEEGMPAGDAFQYLYQIILGQNKGPRAGYFIHSLGKEFMMKRLDEAIKR
ncbi:MAG: lysine--tRNA ligase [Candidatus Thermoplasmatota archaeon]|nr:lysine--tRNA ligase [Candidatus Thermoplasmatota archaeon]